jgi:hypothetical protein
MASSAGARSSRGICSSFSSSSSGRRGSIGVNYTASFRWPRRSGDAGYKPDAILGAVASAAEVERSIRSLMTKLADASPDPQSIPNRTILVVLPDLKNAYKVELKGGKLRGLRKAQTNEATDARITAKSDDLVALIDGRLGVAYAFLTGKVKVDAPASDLMMLRKLF